LMTKNPVTISRTTTVEEAARLMVDQDLSCLPVVEDGKLVGIVSKSDMFKILLELFGARHFGIRLSFLVDDKPGTIAAVSRVISDAGYDIISFGTFMGTDPSNAICTIKVQGCTREALLELLSPHVKEILDIREV
ncbi:MAG: CBS domain-containing protein, partial [Spirochaetales bacterium]|nr:CBS domain-containing protein [Spirochaetales bacterium]